MHSANRGHTEIIELSMEASADTTVRGPQGKTAVDVARQRRGKASGKGRLMRRNAGTLVYEYQGQMRDGRRNGRGVITYADGNRFTLKL